MVIRVGFRYNGKEEGIIHMKNCVNETEGETEEIKLKKCFKYKINNYMGDFINIPPSWDDLNIYNASMAQKVNNKFHPFTNSRFGFLEHPRFGKLII